ncbi:MAG: flagellar basal body rod protein FlgB [Veillonellales bacterium]
MLRSLLASSQVSVLEQALSAASLRQKVISNNIANVNTPGFKKSTVIFEDLLQDAVNGGKLQLTRTQEQHIPTPGNDKILPLLSTDDSTAFRTDGNNVDIDVEMAGLAKNSIYYDAVAQQLGTYFTNLKSAIKGS